MVNPLTCTRGGGKESGKETDSEIERERARAGLWLDLPKAYCESHNCMRQQIRPGLAGRQRNTQVVHGHRQQGMAEGAAESWHLGACWRS